MCGLENVLSLDYLLKNLRWYASLSDPITIRGFGHFLKIKEHDGLKRRNNGTITILYFMCVLPERLSFSLLKWLTIFFKVIKYLFLLKKINDNGK